MRMTTNQNIFNCGHIRKQPDILICPGNSHLGNLIGRFSIQYHVIVHNGPFIEIVKSGNAVEECGFPCPIGSNYTVDFTFREVKIKFISSITTKFSLIVEISINLIFSSIDTYHSYK